MNGNVVVLTIPIFFLLVAFEVWWMRRQSRVVGSFRTGVSNVLCGVLERLFFIFSFGILLWLYSFASEWIIPKLPWRFSPTSPWTFVVALFVSDFCYYWLHRVHHSVNFLWAAHVVHHQPEEMNFTVGLRTAPIQTLLFSAPFYIPAILIGIPPLPFFVANGLMNSLQLLVHTQIDWRPRGPFRFLEKILSLPTHHCVHHGSQDRYLDKNFGAILIVWDRLFGTFAPQTEPVVYGARRTLPTLNPIRAVFDEYRYLYLLGRKLGKPFTIWFQSPATTARAAARKAIDKEISIQSLAKPHSSKLVTSSVKISLSLTVTIVGFFVLLYRPVDEPVVLFVWATHIAVGIFAAGEWLDGSRSATKIERFRAAFLCATAIIMLFVAPASNLWPAVCVLFAALLSAFASFPTKINPSSQGQQDVQAVPVH